jgi:hypothetical protein
MRDADGRHERDDAELVSFSARGTAAILGSAARRHGLARGGLGFAARARGRQPNDSLAMRTPSSVRGRGAGAWRIS